MFFTFFGAATAGSIICNLITFAMIGEINRKRDNSAQMSYFNSSWIQALRVYRALYPRGNYARAQILVFILSLACFLTAFFFLFVVVPQHNRSSRSSIGARLEANPVATGKPKVERMGI
jgi:hypothetical protein